MAKIRVYELARELDRDNKSLEEVIRGLGIPIKNYMSTLTPEEADRVRASAGSKPKRSAGNSTGSAGPTKNSSNKKRSAKTVIRRRRPEVQQRRAERAEAEAEARAVATKAEVATRPAPASSPPPQRRQPANQGGGRRDGGSGPAVSRRQARPSSPAAPQAAPQPVARAPVSRPRQPQQAAVSPTQAPAAAVRRQAPVPPVPAQSVQQAPPQGAGAAAPGGGKASPAVGSRITLPPRTRRLPGGIAARMNERPAEAPQRAPEPPVPPPPPPAPAVAESPQDAGATPEKPAEPPARAAKAAEGSGPARRVVRNEAGVIVGAASQRSEPKILGFIPLAQTRKKQQVIITDAAEEDRRGRATQRKQREERAQAQGRRRKMTRKGGRGGSAPPSKISTVEMSEEKKRIRIDEAIQVSDLAHQMGQKASVVLRALWGMGMRGVTINNAVDFETAGLVAGEFGYTVENVAFQEDEMLGTTEETEGEPRAPVVTMMGHVDHGKTSLLDYIRKSRVAAAESGGITQHIGAYKVSTGGGDIVFLDTPGHEAFTEMRSRGAQVTDIVVLVVAADDGVMPTTVEAIKHAKAAKSAVVIAINKMDKPEANPGRVKQALMEQGIVGEEFGGDTPIVEVSAKTGAGIDNLLETLGLQAEVLELTAPFEGRGQGVVLEARIDKGRGTVATVLVQRGGIRIGDILVANEYSGKVRGLYDHRGKKLKEAGPSTPVEVLGLSGVPSAGDPVNVVENERDAKTLVAHRREQRRRKESVRTGPSIQELLNRRKTAVLKVVLKADVQGSAQALQTSLENLSTEKVKVEVIKAEVGQINETDVKYARAGEAVVFGFNVKTTGKAAPVADSEGVRIHTFSVIYEATEKATELMIGMLEPEYRQKEQGEAEVRALFPIPRLGVVAGCRVVKGLIQRSSHVRVVREGKVLHEGTIGSLKVFKDDVREVKDGFECGILVEGFPGVQEGDVIQAFEVEAIPPTL